MRAAALAVLFWLAAASHADVQTPKVTPGGGTAAPAHHGVGGGGGWVPAQDNSLIDKPCTYTRVVLPDFGFLSDPAHPITTCNNTRLSARQQAACMACIRIRRRDACLKATSDTFFGADTQSCTWMGEQYRDRHGWREQSKSKEVRYSLGINEPGEFAVWLDNSTCYVDFRVEITNPFTQQVFPTAMFTWDMKGAGQFVCTLKTSRRVCEGTIARPTNAVRPAFVYIGRQIWTNRLAAVLEWQKDPTCDRGSPETSVCPALKEPYKFDYTMTYIERPCKRNARPITQGATHAELPFAEVGTQMHPGGETFNVILKNNYVLQGMRRVRWHVQVPRRQNSGPTAAMFVGLMPSSTYNDAACTLDFDTGLATCNFNASLALPGTACYARDCWGSYDFGSSPPKDISLVVAYKHSVYNIGMPWIINATETPPQVVHIDMVESP